MNVAIAGSTPRQIKICETAIGLVPHCNLCWVARSTDETIRKTKLNRPELILMELNIASEVVERIMNECPCAILIITKNVNENSGQVFELMGKGATDVVKIDADDSINIEQAIQNLCNKINMIKHLLGKEKEQRSTKSKSTTFVDTPPLLIIGSSTGGPAALAKLLKEFPDECPFATIIIQHVDNTFAVSLAQWLSSQTHLNVEVAKNGAHPQVNKIFIAAANDHLLMNQNQQLYYTPNPVDTPYRPSVDVFFTSVAKNWPVPSIAVLLTGMGNDGAHGLKLLYDAGWYTIAQSQESCVVFGMPKAAIELGAARQILPIEEMSFYIINKITRVR